MPQLLRELTKKEIWASLEGDPLWDQDDCPDKILDLMRASNGFSVWYVDGDDEIKRTITATSLQKSKIDDVVYVLLDEDSVRGLGIRMQPIRAKTLDTDVNEKHNDLIHLTGRRFVQLAKLIRDTALSAPGTMQYNEIIDEIKNGFVSGRFKRDVFSGKSGNPVLMMNFFRDKTIDFA